MHFHSGKAGAGKVKEDESVFLWEAWEVHPGVFEFYGQNGWGFVTVLF